jgi:hypothetical protein
MLPRSDARQPDALVPREARSAAALKGAAASADLNAASMDTAEKERSAQAPGVRST